LRWQELPRFSADAEMIANLKQARLLGTPGKHARAFANGGATEIKLWDMTHPSRSLSGRMSVGV
jgi:hypothetical protein